MNTVNFAFIVDGVVKSVLTLPYDEEHHVIGRIIAGLQSNPKIIESMDMDVKFGWTWDGTTFSPPVLPE